jgi:Fe-S cluster biogenesis protein NfuA
MEAGVCPGCLPEARREEGEAVALRAALLVEREAEKDRRRLALETVKLNRARWKASAACLSCGQPTRHLGRTRCDACRSVDPEKSALKVRTMEAYGGGCSSCGCSVLAFLRIDHIDRARPEGAPRGGTPLWAWLEARGWPTDHFRCLCSNCNQALEYYGYLPVGGRPPEWDHAALLARVDKARVADRMRDLCARLEALRASEGLNLSEFARSKGLSDGTVMSITRTASGWMPPADATRGAVMPRATPFTAVVLRRVEAALGMAGRLCKSCGEELPPAEFGAAEGYEGRCDHLVRGGKYRKDVSDHCRSCRRAWRLKDRLVVIDKYGGACRCCGEATYEFLAADHVSGVKPEGMPAHGDGLYHRLATEPKRSDYRVLCHQCNFAFFAYGQRCPHEWTAAGATLAEQAGVGLSAIAPAVVWDEDDLLDYLGDVVAARLFGGSPTENQVQVMSQ